jgi:hypothetical protein
MIKAQGIVVSARGTHAGAARTSKNKDDQNTRHCRQRARHHEGAAVAPRLGEASGEVRHPALGDVELALRRQRRPLLERAGVALGPLGARSALGPYVSQAKFVARGKVDGQCFVPRARCRALQQLVHIVQRHEGNLCGIRLDLGCCHAQRPLRSRSDA